MNQGLKWLLAGIGTIVVLFVIAAVVLPMAVDPNDYKQEIRTAILEKTGRELSIGGEIKWTVFPWIGIDISDMELGNRDGFGDRPMLRIGKAGASVRLMPLFSRKIELGKVTLNDMSVYLRRNADGQNNWEDLGGSQTNATSTSSGSDSAIGAFAISEIEINNANVTWDDAGQIAELKVFSLNASNIELGRPFDLEGGFAVNLVQSQFAGEVRFSGRVQSTPDGKRYGIERLKLSFKGEQGAGQEAIVLDMSIEADVDFDLSTDQVRLENFIFQLHDLLVSGELTVTALSDNPKFTGRLKLAEFSPKSLLTSLGMQAPLTTDAAALTSLRAEMRFAGTSNGVNMQDLKLKFDQSIFQGNLKIDNFDQPRVAFDFQIDTLNLDHYLPPTPVETDESDLAVEMFRGFTGGGDFRLGKLVVAGLTATDVSLTMSSDGNGVRLFPISAQFYGGQHQGDIRIDASGKRPILITNQALSGIQAEKLLQDLTGSARLEGTGNFSLEIRTDLTNAQTIRQALSGDIGFNFRDGAIVGINIAESIRTAKAALGQQADSAERADRDPKTDFSELSMTGVITQGILSSDDLLMRSPLLRVTGKGHIDLVKDTIDYLVKPVLVSSLEGQGSQDLDQLSGVPIPVKLTGNLYEPDVKIDFIAAIAGLQKVKLNEKKDEIKDKVLGILFGSKTDQDAAGADSRNDDAEEIGVSTKSLLQGLLGGKRGKDKKKDDDDGGAADK